MYKFIFIDGINLFRHPFTFFFFLSVPMIIVECIVTLDSISTMYIYILTYFII